MLTATLMPSTYRQELKFFNASCRKSEEKKSEDKEYHGIGYSAADPACDRRAARAVKARLENIKAVYYQTVEIGDSGNREKRHKRKLKGGKYCYFPDIFSEKVLFIAADDRKFVFAYRALHGASVIGKA